MASWESLLFTGHALQNFSHKANFCIFYEFGHNTLFTFGYYVGGKYSYPVTSKVIESSFNVCSKMLIHSGTSDCLYESLIESVELVYSKHHHF